jgi:hypothetical protein
MEKYRWLFERIAKIDSQLATLQNRMAIKLSGQILERSKLNYPTATATSQNYMCNVYQQRFGLNSKEFLTSQNLRMFKDAHKLTGYVTAEDNKRLDKL